MLGSESLQGLWRRTLLLRPGAAPDRTTQVLWLQGRRFFVDLRQPSGRPSFAGVTCLCQSTAEQVLWLARQEGFAGEFGVDGEIGEWQREIDFQPPAPLADRGRLVLAKDTLTETGTEADYSEEWQCQSTRAQPAFGLRLTGEAGSPAYLLRSGAVFMYARPRATALPPGGDLASHVLGARDLEAQQALVDFEISFGRVDGTAWRIRHSSLPFKEASEFQPSVDAAGEHVELPDLDADGRSLRRRWRIAECDSTHTASDLAQLMHGPSVVSAS
jgi:hypothetical protein